MVGALVRHFQGDLRSAARAMRRAPVVSAAVVLSIGIGIGVNTAVFSWIQARVLNPVPGAAPAGGLVLVEPVSDSGTYPGVSWLEYGDLRPRLPSLSHLVAFRIAPFSVGAADWSDRTPGLIVSANYFQAFGVRPALGRFFDESDAGGSGREPAFVAVISHGFWRARFAAAPDVVGRKLRVSGRPLTIVGVAPDAFQGTVMGLNFDLWVPATIVPALDGSSRELDVRGIRGYQVAGILRAGAARADTARELDAALRELAATYPDANGATRGEVLPFWKALRGPQQFLIVALALLQVVMLFVLLVVCGNAANLQLARASARRREMSIRLAMGAGRRRVISLVLVESLTLSMLGALAGVLIAYWGTDALRAVPMPAPGGFTLRFQTALDGTGLAFAATLGLLSGLVFGLAPALHLSRVPPHGSAASATSFGGRSRLRDVLMAGQVALALLVLLVAALFVQNFDRARSADPGFRVDGVLLGMYDLRGRGQRVTAEDGATFMARLLEGLRAIPAVEAAAIATSVPLDVHGMPVRYFTLEGRARADGEEDQASANTVTADYFRTMGMTMLSGRAFADLTDTAAPPQVVVNEAFVRRFLPDAEPLGRRLDAAGGSFTISGVVPTTTVNAFGETPVPMIYFSLRDRPSSGGEIHLRVRAGDPTAIGPDVRRALRGLDATVPLYSVRTLADHVDRNLVFLRVPARMFVVLGPVLLMLAAIGIYGVVAHDVAQRTSEIGLRLALGATGRRVVATLVGETMTMVGVGAGAGWLLAAMIDIELLRDSSLDVARLAGVPVVLLGVAAIACWWPARAASRVDPLITLKQP